MNRKIAKTLSALLLLTAIAVAQVPVSDVEAVAIASDFEMDGNKLMRYTGTDETVSVPDGVKIIGEEAFAGNDNLIRVDIGEQVESVGYRAFAECDNLRTVSVGDGVEEIGTAAFSNDRELVNVSLGAKVKKLGSGVFAGSGQLASLSVSEDNNYLHFSNGVLYDSEETRVYALMPACEKQAYTLPSTVKEITGYAFWGNPYLERVSLGSGLYEVPAYAFSNCQNLREVEIPLTVRGIGAKAFEDCVNLSKVILPDSMGQISDSAFDGCPNVEFEATPGTYGAEFASSRKTSEVDEVEYEDVQDAQVIDAETVTGDAAGETDGEEGAAPAVSAEPSPVSGETEKEAEPTPIPEEEEEEAEPTPELKSVTETITNKTLLGQSSIVSGRAVIFIDNRQPVVFSGSSASGRIDLASLGGAGTASETAAQPGTGEQIENLLVDNAQKGKDFPKYTVVNNTKIASQAFYKDKNLTDYKIEDGITEIGEFAFARSAIASVEIPEGVTQIGYGAFYHCDSLKEVTIPDSVTEIAAYAFDKTPWLENLQAGEDFKVVGDGILIAYTGNSSVVNIPDSVKQIAAGVFKEHAGITAVNIPDSVEIIGEEAFMNCQNLKTVNGGRGLSAIKDRAFMNCPLSGVTIAASVKEVGLGAYALSNGTDTVVFLGTELPVLTSGQGAKRLANKEYRTYAFDNIKNAIVPGGVSDLKGTVLETGTYGFDGVVSTESGGLVADNQAGVSMAEDISSGTGDSTGQGSGVMLSIQSKVIPDGENAMAEIPSEEGTFILRIQDSDEAAERISAAYGEIYGGRTPSGLSAYEISLYDAYGKIPITKLGKQSVTVQVRMPANVTEENLHVVTLDQDGQLEAVEHRVIQLDDGKYIQFTTNHFSPYGIYRYSTINAQAVVTNGSAVITDLSNNKDNTPDTGDYIPHPKWFLALGLLAGAIALFFYKGKPKKKAVK